MHNENSYQYYGIGPEFDLGIWLPAIPVVSIGLYFVPLGFNLVTGSYRFIKSQSKVIYFYVVESKLVSHFLL